MYIFAVPTDQKYNLQARRGLPQGAVESHIQAVPF